MEFLRISTLVLALQKRLEQGVIHDHISEVTHNTKQGLIVIGISLVAVFVILLALLERQLKADRKMADSWVEQSLRESYPERVGSNSLVVPLAGLQELFCDKKNQLKHTDNLSPEQIWFATEPVNLGSTNLMCAVVVFEGGRAGIDARGIYRKVSEEEFAKWPHVSAKDAPPRDWGYFTH